MTKQQLFQKTMNTQEMLNDFGRNSNIGRQLINLLYYKLDHHLSSKVNTDINQWKLLMSRIYGQNLKKLDKLSKHYNVVKGNPQQLLFVIHTYFALLLKLMALSIGIYSSNTKQIDKDKIDNIFSLIDKQFTQLLIEVEEGTLFSELLNINNFLTANYYSWYLEIIDQKLALKIKEMLMLILTYKPLLLIRKNAYEDVLKGIYQDLIPRNIRHPLGEYYTPEWLSTFVLERLKFNNAFFQLISKKTRDISNPLSLKVLDPSCGSGTFLISVLARLRLYSQEKGIENLLLSKVLENIVGIDLNPLAVLAAKTNYLLALNDLLPDLWLQQTNKINLPIYLGDSIEIAFDQNHSNLFRKFDYVIGNPPWILWDNLPTDYRQSQVNLWKRYGLFNLSGRMARYGGSKKDISILITYVVIDRFLKNNGQIAFLITQSVWKTKGAGEGFRKLGYFETDLLITKDDPYEPNVNNNSWKDIKIVEVHDFVNIKPFEGANNRTMAFIAKKGSKTNYPVDYFQWNKKAAPRNYQKTSKSTKEIIHSFLMKAFPSIKDNKLSPWITLPSQLEETFNKLQGKNAYSCIAGYNSGGANGVYWIDILKVVSETKTSNFCDKELQKVLNQENDLLTIRDVEITNITTGTKRKVKKITTTIEDFLIYPVLKTRNIKKWGTSGYTYAIQPQNPLTRKGYEQKWLRQNLPKTFAYLSSFEDILRSRASYKKYLSGNNCSFYSIYNIGFYSFSPYKVVWNQMGNNLKCCVVSKISMNFLGQKIGLPEHVLAFIPMDNKEEAHYVCGIMNSCFVEFILKSIAGGTKSFGTPKIVEETIKIPSFDPTNHIHRNISYLSQQAHLLTKNGQKTDDIEEKLDNLVANLFNLDKKEILLVKKFLSFLDPKNKAVEIGEVELIIE